ncbi:Uncharacterised protein [Mycobacteroides abscessus subsp. abscessus]|nr:Uncharacterised protein [Mycobacteroides abscessus subsp. abscessus]
MLRKNPSTMWNEPNADSTVVVSDAALPRESTTVTWLVPCSGVDTAADAGMLNSPGLAMPIVVSPEISRARPARYVGFSRVSGELPGSATKSVSATYLSRSA